MFDWVKSQPGELTF